MKRRPSHPKSFGRRAWLSGAGSLCVGLPLLESLGHAAGGWRGRSRPAFGPPQRVVFFVTTNGTNPASHWPTGSEHEFTLGPIMAPLQAYRDRMIVMRGIDNQAAMATGINGHTDALRCMFTGRIAANTANSDSTAGGGISIDQFIANAVGQETAFKSLEFVRGVYASTYPNFTSFYDAFQPAPFESDAIKFWDRVFATVSPSDKPDPELLRLRADRKSVLDTVQEQYITVRRGLNAADRRRLDAHLAKVRDLERRILDGDVSDACVVPEAPASHAMEEPNSTVGMDMIAYALSCDLTRVATIGLRYGQYGHLDFGGIDVSGSYHDDWLHNLHNRTDAPSVVDTVKSWQAGQLAHFLDTLASIPEGTGSVLDNTLVVWADEFCHGYAHTHNEVPYVLFSGGDGFFDMGRYLNFGTPRSNNELWIAVARAMGVDGDFGDPQFGNAPLPGLA